MTATRRTDTRTFAIDCPQCGEAVRIIAHLSGRLTIDEDTAAVRLVVKAKPVSHRCREEMNLTPLPGMSDVVEHVLRPPAPALDDAADLVDC